ncbi:helix-turn-helix domain-containing protein [Streptomyces sioyaensis]|uniref:helix-turn-helix domain-containing protein n=1 Tax=Streptomyces sioyaensis TaxID=67364 RepID=UPI00371AFB24
MPRSSVATRPGTGGGTRLARDLRSGLIPADACADPRRQRLEGARRDLTDPALHRTPVHAIAARWGYHRATDFSRAYRAAYGIAPMEHRRPAVAGRLGTVLTPSAGAPATHPGA